MKFMTVVGVPSIVLSVTLGAAWAQNASKPTGGEAPPAGGEEQMKKPSAGAMKSAPEGEARPAQAPKPGGTAEKMPPESGTKPQAEPGRAAPAAEGQNAPDKAAPTNTQKAEPGKAVPANEQKAEPGKAGQPAAATANGAKPAGEKPAAARPAPKITATQQTRVREVIRQVNVQPVHVDFNVSIGVAVPRTVELRPLPREILVDIPDYDGYDFFVVPGEIVIVDPDTFEIVAVLPI